MPQPRDSAAPSVTEPRGSRRRLLFLLKLGVTFSLCAWIALHVQWSSIWEQLSQASISLVLVVYGLNALSIPISALKWQQLLAVHGVRYRIGWLVRWYFVAFFLGHFLPTSIGGDGFRIYKTWRNPRSRACALLAVFAERVSGIAALMLLGYVAAAFVYVRLGDRFAGLFLLLGSIGLAVGVPGVILLWGMARRGRLDRLAASERCPSPIAALALLANDFRVEHRRTAAAAMISFLFHALRIGFFWLMILALGLRADPLELTLAIAITELVGLLPISLGGLGLVDGVFIYLMSRYGLSHEVALSTMLLIRVPRVPLSLIGAYFYASERRAPPAPAYANPGGDSSRSVPPLGEEHAEAQSLQGRAPASPTEPSTAWTY